MKRVFAVVLLLMLLALSALADGPGLSPPPSSVTKLFTPGVVRLADGSDPIPPATQAATFPMRGFVTLADGSDPIPPSGISAQMDGNSPA
jgi:hypothetical protein